MYLKNRMDFLEWRRRECCFVYWCFLFSVMELSGLWQKLSELSGKGAEE